MEEHDDERCSVIYYCAGAGDDVHELYHNNSPPEVADGVQSENAALDGVYRNVRALLDQDQGGFHEVFLSSRAETCVDRLETYANSVPTVVLVELNHTMKPGSPLLLPEKMASSYPFLRALAADIQGARYQRHVMPFALVKSASTDAKATLDAGMTEACLNAGALDIVHSPLDDEDLNRLVGHVKEMIRPSARLLGANMAQNLVGSIRSSTPTNVATHRPDQTLPEERRKVVEEAVGSWHFPAQSFSMDELTYAALFMVEHLLQAPELEPFRIPRAELMTFLLATRRQYKHSREVHYHNWRHAVDVTQSLYCFLLDVQLRPLPPSQPRKPKNLNAVERLLTPFDALVLLTSAIGHDVGHPGVNNAFLVACNHPLAQMYNDKSVLENYHCAAYSQLLRRHWPSLAQAAGFRPTMISTILATDMQRHFEYMTHLADLKRKVENSESDPSDWSEKDREHAREVMMALLMKAADISNVARPFDISSQWAKTLMNEFSRQGELESELGMPTCLFGGPPNKEDILAAAQSQKGFMSLFGFPLFSGMTDLMSVDCAITELENNSEIWDQRIGHEKQRRESDGTSAPLTFSSVSKEEVEEAKIRSHKSEPLAVPEEISQMPSTPTRRHPVVDGALSPSGHPAHRQRQHDTLGMAQSDDQRSSTPAFPGSGIPLSPTGNASRRSSKDVALDSIQQLSSFAHNSLSPNVSPSSRRGSADAAWQVHQSYPGSRRGSKDESLTTILVTSQGSPRKNSSSSPGGTPRATGSPGKQSRKRQSMTAGQKQDVASRYSVPSSRSHTTSSATAATTLPSPSTQASSLSPTDDEPTPPAVHHNSIAATEDPFVVPGNWPSDLDGAHRPSAPDGMPSDPPLPPAKSESPRIIARMANGEPEDVNGRGTPRKEGGGLRESRSRSRLRGLKFWKKKRDVSGVEAGDGGSP